MQNQQNQPRFFIYDCNGQTVGNPKGYATIKGATRQQNQRGSKAYNAIWAAYDLYKQSHPGQNMYFVSSVKMKGEVEKNHFHIS